MYTEFPKKSFYGENGVSLYLIPSKVRRPYVSARPLILGSLDDLKLIDDPTMQYGKGIWRRLNNFVRLTWGPNKTSVYIVDHHQFAFYGWAEAFAEGRIQNGAKLAHWDAHPDADICKLRLMSGKTFSGKRWSLKTINRYVHTLTGVEFIEPGLRLGLLGEFYHIAYGWDCKRYPRNGSDECMMYETGRDYYMKYLYRKFTNKVSDIDLDYFEYDFEGPNIEAIRKDIETAGVATIATSPGFIEPEKAIDLVRRLLS